LPLLRLQARGIVEYGRLASRLGRQFEERWVDADHRTVDAEALGAPDFSATVDLFDIVANAQNINPMVLGIRHVAALVAATLLPYVPVLLAVMPFDQLVQVALKALV